ncbi:hypothetical protein J7J47_03725 [Halomonas sp. ISL-60]|uniref:hypothetical protein n=1 Tax=Halomonas sp. ISL-56 TaxID=2819149 RepID=UPI001BEA82AB|nr:hypothetical protein [Halomonas sp. ISL-56]MBT2771339.1 hypothetical protein [Halomonas sp. ISL-60]MBT2800696.1 hypothetical protein [Halomonas sp. ISL-56]
MKTLKIQGAKIDKDYIEKFKRKLNDKTIDSLDFFSTEKNHDGNPILYLYIFLYDTTAIVLSSSESVVEIDFNKLLCKHQKYDDTDEGFELFKSDYFNDTLDIPSFDNTILMDLLIVHAPQFLKYTLIKNPDILMNAYKSLGIELINKCGVELFDKDFESIETLERAVLKHKLIYP